ncbi:MAG: hypothetical protein EAZ85_09405 [Bacteroidetes bacterium]|nr:MAG: hypothetical protein EAZ85_09405 [Bacteroidota bacterium]TAG88617.1 MAG: hypothetical protein EAZ20_08220 [Bacteroidota bacterium]
MVEPEPFFGHFFTGMVKKITFEIDTLAVSYQDGLVILYINPKFWTIDLAPLLYRIGVIKHEILHIVYQHILAIHKYRKKMIFNLAADLVVNQYIKSTHLPEGAILLSCFPELKLRPHESVLYYYNRLNDFQKECEDNKKCKNCEEKGCQDCKNQSNLDKNQSWKNLKNFLDQENTWQKKHKAWEKLEDLSNAEKEIANDAIKKQIRDVMKRLSTKDWGKTPGELKSYLDLLEHNEKPVINWKRALKLFANSSSKTSLKNTIRRASKRYGTTPGIKILKKQKILVALDTSGSVSDEDLKEFFGELHHIWKQRVEIFVVECDTKIGNTYHYKGIAPNSVSGQGGTIFDEPIRYANDVYRPDALIYFTDGYADVPKYTPICPMLWLVCTNGTAIENMVNFPGRKVQMKNKINMNN